MRRLLCTAFAAAIVYFLGGCGAKADMEKAEAAVDAFHAQLNTGSFDDIYNNSDDLLKNATSQERFVNLLSAVHRKLGTAKSADQKGFFLNYGNQGKIIRLTYSTQYGSDQASEEFIFHASGDRMMLAGYHINSDALITQ